MIEESAVEQEIIEDDEDFSFPQSHDLHSDTLGSLHFKQSHDLHSDTLGSLHFTQSHDLHSDTLGSLHLNSLMIYTQIL